MFRLIKLFFMILLINDKIFAQLTDDQSVTNPTINLTDIDTGTLLSGIFSVNTVSECPGTCIHAIAALFCDEILDNISCASEIFRCCAVFNNSTLVETSPPLEEITTLAPINESQNVHSSSYPSSPVHSSASTNSLPNVTKTSAYLYSSTPDSLFTTTSAIIVQKITPKCSGYCMESELAKYCGNILTADGVCGLNEFCCLQSNRTITTILNIPTSTEPTTDSVDLNSLISSTVVDTTTTTSAETTKTETPKTETTTSTSRNQTQSEKKLDEETFKNPNETILANEKKHDKNSDESSGQQSSDLPACENCVTLIFSFLCDEIDNTKYCPNDGKCCKYYDAKDDLKTTQSSTQATNQLGKCPGTCIPAILSGICSKPSEIIFKTTTCITGMLCCYTPMTDQNEHFNVTNDKPSLLDNSDDLTFIEPSEQTLNTKLTHFKPPSSTTTGNGYYQLVPRPHQLMPNQFTSLHQSTSPPTNPLISSPNWPFLNNQHHQLQKIPIYKPLLSNSQMIPSYLSNNGLTTALTNSLNNGRPNYVLNNLNNFNNRSPALFYPPSSSTSDLFSNLNVHLANGHLSNNMLPSLSAFKRNSTANMISHLLLTNNIQPSGCTGTCIPPIFKFTCFGSSAIYTNFICNKPQQVCCASSQDIEIYESNILGGLNNETNLINNLVHNNYFANLMSTGLPATIGSNTNGLNVNLVAGSMPAVSNNIAVNKPMGTMNTIKNLGNKINKNANKNYNLNKMQPIDRIANKDQLADKFMEINQPIPAASNMNRNRYYPSANLNKNVQKLTPILNTNKWSNSLSPPFNLSSGHFTPSEKPLNQKPVVERVKKPELSTHFSPIIEHRPMVELASASRLPVCGLPNDITRMNNNEQHLKWCWQVALVNQENQYICSGALIGMSWVVTAANCISKIVQNAEPIFVRVGESDLTSSSLNILNLDAQTQKANTTYIHHNHNGETLENDIALIKLQRPLQLKSNICLICLPARGSTVQTGKRCTVTGYNSETSFKLRESSQSILNDHQCSKKISSLTNRSFILPTSSFCAEGEDETCNDLGGPLVCSDKDNVYELAGLMSYSFESFDCKAPGIFVKVSNFIGWINQIISVNN